MIGRWAVIESDFMREYGIDLQKEISGMSWRRFNVLLRNLSPHSLLVQIENAGERHTETNHKGKKVEVYTDPEAGEKAAFSLWGL